MDNDSVIGRLVQNLTEGADRNEIIIQVAVAMGAIAFSFFVARFFCTRIQPKAHWKFGKGDFENVAFAWLSTLLVWAAKHGLTAVHGGDGGPLEVILGLLLVWALVRTGKYVLGHVIPDGGFQRIVIRVFNVIVLLGVIQHLFGVLPDALAALDAHGISIGKEKREVTLLDVLKGLAAIFLAVVTGLWISRVTEGRVMAADSMEVTTRVVISKVVKIAVVLVAIFVALPIAGIDITTLSIFSGAVGVGLGFGLQKIASNYVSGFIVLLDHSLRIGDIITVDGRRGEVTAIESRYTVIKGADGVESIIPNEKLITDSVNHHTYSDPKISMVITVTVSYESDVEKACELLVAAAKSQQRVIPDPPAAARVKLFRDHGIDLELTVWITDPAVGDGDLRSDIYKAILVTYRQAGIEIPYPRRDVRLLATPAIQETRSPSAT